MMKICIPLTFVFLLTAGIQAQVTADTTQIDEVIIKTTNESPIFKNETSSVQQLTKSELNRNDQTIITNSLNRLPGVFMQQAALNTNRIFVRGIGARSQYSTNRLRAYFNDIPLTNANGETILADIDLESLQKVILTKGPNNSIYGAELGGSMQLIASQLNNQDSFARFSNVSGSYGLQKNSLQAGFGSEKKRFLVTYNRLESDGFRENSSYNRQSLTISGELLADEQTKINFLTVVTDLKAYIPSSLSLTDFENNPQQAASNWQAAEGYESYTRGLMGLSVTHQFNDRLENKTGVFFNFKNAYEPRPFDILDENSIGFGARTNFNWQPFSENNQLKLQFGGEFLQEFYQVATYENRYQDFENQGSVQGNALSNLDQNRSVANTFLQINYQITAKWKAVGGINLNSTRYKIEDRFLNNENNQTGSFRYATITSPRIGSVYEITNNQQVFGNISRGYSIPTVEESLTPEGTLNTDLNAEKGWNYELGFRGNWWQKSFITELSFYSMHVDDLLVARRVAEDRFVGVNAGKTIHNGAEILLKSVLSWNHNLIVKPYFSGSFHFYKFDEFVDQGNDYAQNELTGVPDKILNLGIDLNLWKNVQFNSNWRYVGQIPLNDANEIYADAYQLLNFKIAYQFKLAKSLNCQLHFGVNNALDKNYAASILPNAIGFGDASPRFYYPGNPRNYYGGITLDYQF
ncbi:MAG: TonB-dependent receptor family protein [Bacteroidota bacterium]